MAIWTSELNNQSDSLPTVNQWLKTVSTEGAQAVRIVKLIWTPNLYDNYSIDTEAYRLRIAPAHYLFAVIENNLDDWVETGAVLALEIEKLKVPKISLLTLDTEICDWDELGKNGFKSGSVRARPKNVSSKTRYKQTKPAVVPTEDEAEQASA